MTSAAAFASDWEALCQRVDELAAEVASLRDQLAKTKIPERPVTVAEFSHLYPDWTPGRLRFALFNRASNGLEAAVIQVRREEDFFILTRIKPEGFEGDRSVILTNSILVHTMLVQRGLIASGMRWHKIVFDFIDNARLGLEGDQGYRATFVKLMANAPEFLWCELRKPVT